MDLPINYRRVRAVQTQIRAVPVYQVVLVTPVIVKQVSPKIYNKNKLLAKSMTGLY